MEPIYYVSIIAQLLTYASFLSGAKVCQLIYKQKSCAKFSPAPFFAGLNCTALWLRYGFIADEWEIIAVNSVGLVCQAVYLGFFLVYSKQKSQFIKQLLSLMLFLGGIIWSINHSVDPMFLGGSLASVSSLIACASPLITIQDVLRTKCVASMPFPIIISSFVVSLSWLVYGILKEDKFIIFSNMVAVSISGAQLALFLIYPSSYPYERLSPSNKKSYDLIRLLNSDADSNDFDIDLNNEEIDTNRDYKATLGRVIGQIYSKRERMSKTSGTVMLLYAN